VYIENTQGIEVAVKPEYLPEESSPQRSEFLFAYHITITNKGETEVQLMSRHWIITDGWGAVHEVKGDGIIGKQPVLQPGQSHSYSSFCPLTTATGNMRGSFHMVNKQGAHFDVRVPVFFLRDLRSAH